MTNRSAAFSLAAALRRAVEDPSPTIGFYDRRSRRFDVEPAGHFIRSAATAAQDLIEGGVTPGRPVLVAGTGPEQLWLGYLAAALAGGLPLVLPIRPALDRAADVARRLAAARRQVPDGLLAVGTTGGEPVIDPGPGPWLSLTPPDRRSSRSAADALLDRLDRLARPPAAPLHLQLTSGSTADPRPVVITGANAEANVGAFARAVGITVDSHLVCWLPLYHDLALVGSALTSLLAGCHLRLLSPFDFLADPAHWLAAVSQSPGAVSAGPNFALDQVVRRVEPARHPDLDLTGWHTCLTGAEPVDMPTVDEFRRKLAPLGLRSEAIRPGYGLAEATLVVSLAPRTGPRARRIDDGLAGPVVAACLGPAIDGVSVEIVEPEGEVVPALAEGRSGEVMVSGPAVSPGYRRPDGTIEAFPFGRCRTGDLGLLLGGELYLIDRLKNVIIRHGRNWSAAALEAQLAHGAGVPGDRCAVVQNAFDGGRVVVVVERGRRGDDEELLARVRRAATELDVGVDEVLLVRRGGLPRTTSGKKQHAVLRAGLQIGELEVVARVVLRTEAGGVAAGSSVIEPETAVIDLRADGPGYLEVVIDRAVRHARRHGWLDGPPVGEHTALRDLGLDSLAVVELAAELYTEFGATLGEDSLETVATVGDLARAARSATGEGLDSPADRGLLARLSIELPQLLRRVDAQRGRQLLIDGRWVTDLASVNYLGLDLEPDVLGSIGPMVERWGTHPSWTRIVASPAPYHDLEGALARLTGAPDTLVFPTITLTHLGLLPLLATRADTLVVDRSAHRSVQEAAELAAARGATLRRFEHRDPASLARALDGARGRPVVALNGVYSMTGTVPDLAAIVDQAAAAGGLVYVDDAHGLGILGRRSGAGTEEPYGSGGGGVVTHLGLSYDHIVYVAGLSKAFSSMGAFVTCRHPDERARFEQASTVVFSGPVPVASLATALAGLAVNAERGDGLRRHLHRLTARAIDGARARGWAVDNPLAFPVVNLVTGGVERTVAASRVMWEHGILFTPSVFPAAPLHRGGFRLSFTAANTDDDVDRLLAALDAVTAALGPPPALVAAWSSVPDA